MLAYLVPLSIAMCLIGMSNGFTTPDPTTTPFREITECEIGRIRAHSNPNKFEQLTQDENGTDVWILANCQQALLIFNETLCACVNPPLDICPYRPMEGSVDGYIQTLTPFATFTCDQYLIWNQTGCRCDWGPDGPRAADVPEVMPCETIFSTTFDSSSVGDIQLMPWGPVRTVPEDGADGEAFISLSDVAAVVWKVSYTDFGPGFVIDFRFKARDDLGSRDSFVALVSNGCWSTETIAVNYRSADRTYGVILAAVLTESRTRTTIQFACQDTSAVSDGFQWNKVSLSFRQGTVNLMVNDVLCHSDDMTGAIPDKPKCPLVIGHDIQPVAPRPGLFGWFDDFSVRRFCPS